MKISWENFLIRRGVTPIAYMRQSRSRDYETLVANLKTLGVRPPTKGAVLIELDKLAAEDAPPPSAKKSTLPVNETPAVSKSVATKKPVQSAQKAKSKRGRRKKSTSE
tara:strand:- start:530 stop:853 length:324 start_codon:yes stop_codon:yes gene_type:complete